MNEEKKMWLAKKAFVVVTFPLAVLPHAWALKVCGGLAVLIAYFWPGRRSFAVDNIKKSVELGSLDISESPAAVAGKSFAGLGKCFAEGLKIYHGFGRRIFDNIEIVGAEHYLKARSKNKGVILFTGHCGNWELMGLVMAREFGPVQPVARPLNNRYANQILEDLRSITGNHVIYKEGAVRSMLTALRNHETVGILVDQAVLKDESCVVGFLGRPALTTKLPAILARKTGAVVVPVFVNRNDDGSHTLTIHPELELSRHEDRDNAVREDTQSLTVYVESFIRQYPSQWLWGHRRWKRAPETFDEDQPTS